jgi:hypothetical protein
VPFCAPESKDLLFNLRRTITPLTKLVILSAAFAPFANAESKDLRFNLRRTITPPPKLVILSVAFAPFANAESKDLLFARARAAGLRDSAVCTAQAMLHTSLQALIPSCLNSPALRASFQLSRGNNSPPLQTRRTQSHLI